MSYHILHLTTPNCYLSVDRGLLFCKLDNGDSRMIALQDLKAIIVVTHGVSFSNNCLTKLLENNVIILHCDNHFQPKGWSLPLERIVRTKVFYNQISRNNDFETELWKLILKCKALNQANNLELIGDSEHNLFKLINRPLMSEANIARQYWEHYFSDIGNPQKREHQWAETFENGCLNYGYAIINTLIYRSIIIHGLIASLGIHHLGKYKSTPLVYDLMEPYRPFVDYYFYKFSQEYEEEYDRKNFKAWSRYIANCIKNYRLKINDTSYKIVDTIDIYIEKITDAYIKFDCSNIFLPKIEEQYLYIDKQRNREYEE